MRQPAGFDPLADRHSAVVTLTRDYASGHRIPLHFHDRDQLVYASRGVMTVRTTDGSWVVPTHRAVWIPETIPHSIAMSGTVAMRTLYFRPRAARSLPEECCVVNVSPLLRELILHVCSMGALRNTVQAHRHVIQVILDQLRAVQLIPLQLPHPADVRALRVADALLAHSHISRSITSVCRTSGASRRTIERLFLLETGLTLGKWRQQLRLMEAMRLLGAGAKVTHTALEAGYSTPSAFIAAFRRTLGMTPTAYFGSATKDPRPALPNTGSKARKRLGF